MTGQLVKVVIAERQTAPWDVVAAVDAAKGAAWVLVGQALNTTTAFYPDRRRIQRDRRSGRAQAALERQRDRCEQLPTGATTARGVSGAGEVTLTLGG